MAYKFKALVVDDMPQMVKSFDIYQKYLKVKKNIDIDFKAIHSEEDYDENEAFDILLVDYNLKHGFFNNDKTLGNQFIESFRKKNKISKIIFYSSEFEYDVDAKRYKFNFPAKEIFNLINDLQVDKIAAKDNFNMMLEVIAECCEELDIVPLILSRTLSQYKEKDISVTYTDLEGEEIEVASLLEDIIKDSKRGRAFKEQLVETVMTVLFNYKY